MGCSVSRKPKPLTPEEMAAHVAECDGCSLCQGEPPWTELEHIRLYVESFDLLTGATAPNPALTILDNAIIAEKARRSTAATKAPRATREALEQYRANYITIYKKKSGWVKAAANFYDIDEKTVWSRMQGE